MEEKQSEYEVSVEFGDKNLMDCIENILNSLAEKNGYILEKRERTG